MFFARAGIRLQTSARIAVTLPPVSIKKVNFVSAIFPATEVLFEAWTSRNELCSKSAIKLSLGLIQSGISVSADYFRAKLLSDPRVSFVVLQRNNVGSCHWN